MLRNFCRKFIESGGYTEEIIAQVRKYEDLYDKRFRDPEQKEWHWQQVGNVIGISALTAKRRWTILKNRYLRIRKKPNPSNEWQFYNYLRFLDPVYFPEGQRKEKDIKQEQQSEILFEPHLEEIPRHIRKTITSSEPHLEEIPRRIQKTIRSYKPHRKEIPKHIQKTITGSEPCLEEIPQRIQKTIRSYKPRHKEIPKHIQKTITGSEPCLEKIPQRIRGYKPRPQEIPKHIQKIITSSESVIINEDNYGFESKSSDGEMCDYELKLSNEDHYTYELKINTADTCRYGLDNIQNRIYELNKMNKGRRVYGKQHKDDCESFAQFVAAKLRTLQTDAERNAMKQRILQAINYSSEQAEAGILDIVFIEGEENED